MTEHAPSHFSLGGVGSRGRRVKLLKRLIRVYVLEWSKAKNYIFYFYVYVHIRSYRKVQTYREKMNRLHQLKNQYPVDLFNSFVARLRSANAHLIDERSSGGHD